MSYHPTVPQHTLVVRGIRPDTAVQKALDSAIPQFLEELDAAKERLRAQGVVHWRDGSVRDPFHLRCRREEVPDNERLSRSARPPAPCSLDKARMRSGASNPPALHRTAVWTCWTLEPLMSWMRHNDADDDLRMGECFSCGRYTWLPLHGKDCEECQRLDEGDADERANLDR